MNWKKMLKFAGISMGICLALVLGVIVAYSQMFVTPEVTVTQPAFTIRPDSALGHASSSNEWEADFSDALAFVPEPFVDDWDEWERKENFYTILVLALDETRNSDVMWVVSFDTENHVMNIIDIPRDTRVPIAPRNVQRINAAYANGRLRDGHEEGVRQVKQEVAWLIGFEVDFYVTVEMMAFARAIDDIFGGVTVHVPFPMVYYSPLHNPPLHINLPAGTQRLNGTQAVHFARWRQQTDHTGNIGTVRRGQHIFQLFEALAREAWGRMPGFLLQVPGIIEIYDRYVNTNLGTTNLLYFAEAFLLNDVDINYERIPAGYTTRPRWYDMPYHDETLELVNTMINPFVRDIQIIMPEELPEIEGD